MKELKIEHITSGSRDTFEITDTSGNHVTMDPQEALMVLQFLYSRAGELAALVNGLEQTSEHDVPGDDYESIETHLQELNEAEHRQAESEIE